MKKLLLSLIAVAGVALAAEEPLCISGVYPHLTAYNGSGEFNAHGECGIGAVVPWAGKLWFLTYPPHSTRGSTDKLYSVAPDLALTIQPESVGGTHACRMITDLCTWRGLLVLAGCRTSAGATKNFFKSADGKLGLWFGAIDDLWKLGKPVGVGGPWKQSAVKAGTPSDPYLMTGYDQKRVLLSHNAAQPVEFKIEVDVANEGHWKTYATLKVEPGQTLEHKFPDTYGAHWVRLTAAADCTASAEFHYE